jgi:uncharacterized protein YlxW (UPF0749 family)
MLAVLYDSVQNPDIQETIDTRDTWELRSDMLKEQEKQADLLREIGKLDEKIYQYDTARTQNKEQVFRETLEELKADSGLTDINGTGIIIKIVRLNEQLILGEKVSNISPDLVKRLWNELNRYGAEHLSINGQRVINSTVIREINGETKVDGYPLVDTIEIKVMAEDVENLKNRIQGSQVMDEFYLDNYEVMISEPIEKMTLPAYKNQIRIQYMEPAVSERGGNS